jgi:hypothetical protein
MPWGVAAAAVAAGGAAYSSNQAAKGQQAAAELATQEQQRQFDVQQANQAPYRAAGYTALQNLGGLANQAPIDASSVINEPGYQFGLKQGTNALESSAAGGGSLYSGAVLKALQQYGNDYGTTKYDDAWNRINTERNQTFNRNATLAGIGQTANTQLNQAGTNLANNVGNIQMSNANAQGAASIAQGNIWGNAFNNFAGIAQQRGWGRTAPSTPWYYGGSGQTLDQATAPGNITGSPTGG